MRKFFLAGIFAFLGTLVVARHNFALTIFKAEDIHRTELENGFSVVTKILPDASVTALDMWIKTGTISEDYSINGISHFVEHLLFEGTKLKGSGEIEQEIRSVGGEINAATSMDFVHVYLTVPHTQTEFALERMLDIVFLPTFPRENIEAARADLIAEMKQKKEDIQNDVFFMLRDALYNDHPYRMPVVGREDVLRKLQREELVNYYEKYFYPKNMSLIAVGNFDSEKLEKKVKEYMAALSFKPQAPDAERLKESPIVIVRHMQFEREASQAHLAIGFHAPSVKDRPDVYAMDLILTLLGEGKMSRLYTDLKEKKKLVSEIDCDFLTQHDPGIFVVAAATEEKNLEKVEKEILKHLELLTKNLVSKDELARANRVLESMVAFDSETPEGQASFLGFYENIDTLDFALTYIDEVKKVTPEALRGAAKKYFKKNNYAVVVAVPKGNEEGGDKKGKTSK